MLNCLLEIKNTEFDCVTFLPNYNDNDENDLVITGQTYINPGEKIGGNDIGDEYHIVLFKENEYQFTDLDHFEAILGDPLEYISNLIPVGFFGMIAKKTTTSHNFVEKVLDKIKQAM